MILWKKKEESRLINEKVRRGELRGLEPLCDRINFLKGVSYKKINEKLSKETYLRKGTIPKMNGELIKRIDISDFSSKDFKYDACLNII